MDIRKFRKSTQKKYKTMQNTGSGDNVGWE